MDEPLTEHYIQRAPPILLQQQRSPRRKSDQKITPPTVTPAESPEHKQQNAIFGSVKSSFRRPGTKSTNFMHGSSVQAHVNRGQQFTVGNISNGMIYLRPVNRPAHDLQQQFVLPPNTPPSSAEEKDGKGWHVDVGDRRVRKQLPPTPLPKTPPRTGSGDEVGSYTSIKSSPPIPRTRNNRAHSYSTINDNCPTSMPPELEGFRMKIERADGHIRERMRPRTAGHPTSPQKLDVQIPHYSLGSPHFLPSGTPFLYGASSLHIPSMQGELGTSSTVSQQTDVRWLWPGVDPTSLLPSAISSPMPSPSVISSPTPDVQIPLMSLSSFISSSPRRQIRTEIYDKLSFPPSSEDPLIVRYDSRQEISAAIPARIISQITSAKFVDYHLLSDFFLTFRLFMSSSDLVAYLVTRLHWAFNRDDDTGRVVRVRTFVAIRHWLLNYFADDFVPSLPLREQFVKVLNELSDVVRSSGNPSDMKIIRELKRCWRRTCALYWDTSICVEISIDQEIIAGGPPGVRCDRSQSALLRPRTAAPRLESLLPDHSPEADEFMKRIVETPTRSKGGREKSLRFTSSPSNCEPVKAPSLPCFTSERASITGRETPLAQPVHSTFKTGSTETIAPVGTVNTTAEDRIRSSPHKRSGSLSDALRDTRQPLPLPKSLARSTHLLLAFPYAGSLVRGNLFPPTQAYVGVVAPSTPVNELANFTALTTFNSSNSGTVTMRAPQRLYDESFHENKGPNGPGMKRFLGSVRRALSGRVGGNLTNGTVQPPFLVTRPSYQRPPLGAMPRESMSVAHFMGADAPGRNSAGMSGGPNAARIDLLGAGIVETFERVMQQQMAATEAGWEQEDCQVNEETTVFKNKEIHLDGVMDEQLDEIVDVGSNISQDGSVSLCLAEIPSSKPAKKHPSIYEQSQSSFVTLRSRYRQQGRLGENSTQYQDTDSSAETDSNVFPRNSRLPRRSKSLSFENSQRNPYIFQVSGIDNESLHSARSLSMERLNSGRSQYSVGMDEIPETFHCLSPPESKRRVDSQPSKVLRRRPGGDLRAAATIGGLDMPRPRSTGSVDTTTFSTAGTFRVSIYDRPASTIAISRAESPHQPPTGVISLGAVAQGGGVTLPKSFEAFRRATIAQSLGLDPKVSFEVGVQKLRDLPDTASDDGGIEVALMKLEGTYQKKKLSESSLSKDMKASEGIAQRHSRQLRGSSVGMARGRWSDRTFGLDDVHDPEDHTRRMRRRQRQVFDHTPIQTLPTGGESSVTPSVDHGPIGITITNQGAEVLGGNLPFNLREKAALNKPLPAVDGCELSHDSVPIKYRGLSLRPSSRDIALRSVDLGLDKNLNKPKEHIKDATSELSSELSFEIIQPEINTPSIFPPVQSGTIIAELGIPSHPLRHPPSPSLNFQNTSPISPSQATPVKKGPCFPTPSSFTDTYQHHKPSADTSLITDGNRQSNDSDTPIRPSSIHLPFILAYDSELLAKQFTLIEKDALMEVDWKELVELRWSQTGSNVKDWVEFLNSKDIRGVEVVIARFNLMCKWARSEIVMTKDIYERAKTVVKLIHIAAHARRLQNFATMYQITIALLTADVARLRQTWSFISTADMSTFKEMEALVQPVRNFHNLRTEMDKVTGESGCIPFVGIFTHDLILNAQRALFITTSPTTESLVNFERHRTTAAIVKKLLRLIETSHKYDFKAVDGVCERCLWIASLTDEEIRDLSKSLE